LQSQMEQKENRLDNIHVVLWLIKDLCWVLEWKYLGLFMVFPTIGMALFIFLKSAKYSTSYFFNLAIVCWIIANSSWMIGELFFSETQMHHIYILTKYGASTLFIIGLGVLFLYLLHTLYFKHKKVGNRHEK